MSVQLATPQNEFIGRFSVVVAEKPCRLNWSMQHHLIGMIVLKVVFMAQGKRNRLSAEQRADMWRRWKAGESLHEIGRAFGKGHGSIRFLLTQRGGIVPAARRRSPRTLTLAEREDIFTRNCFRFVDS